MRQYTFNGIVLTEGERRDIRAQLSKDDVLAQRAKIIELLASGDSVSIVAQKLGIAKRIVWKWAERFSRERINGLEDAPHG